MFSILAVSWEPQLRGYVIVAIAIGVLIGGTYLVVGTNLGARLGFLVVLAGLFGWMATMGAIWWTYGIGLKGREPTWQPADPTTIVRSSDLLDDAENFDHADAAIWRFRRRCCCCICSIAERGMAVA